MDKGIWMIGGIVMVTAVVCGFAASRAPWQMLREQEAKTARQVADMRDSEAKRESLLRQEAHLRSSVGREESARAQGYLGPGEKSANPIPPAED